EGVVRVQDRNGSSDAIAGVGGILRVNRSTNLAFRVGGGSDNVSLPNGDATMEVRHYVGPFELGFNYRYLSFADVKVSSYSPILAWDAGTRWRLATRYSYSWSSLDHRQNRRRSLRTGSRLVPRDEPIGLDGHLRVRHRKLRRPHRRSDRQSGRAHPGRLGTPANGHAHD